MATPYMAVYDLAVALQFVIQEFVIDLLKKDIEHG